MLNETDLARADLNLLVLFETVMTERHVGRAALRLHVSPSAISHGLARLRRLLNDPLFLKTPKGVVPTGRAIELAGPIADVLSRARSVIATAEPFDPAKSARRFTIGAPDGVAAVLLLPLVAELRRHAPNIDISVRQLLPVQGETSPERAWRDVFVDLESRALDIAIIPSDETPARFEARHLYDEDFVIATSDGHPFADDPTLRRYTEAQHVVVSASGDPYGIVDEQLARQGRSRRVALTVPNFLFALAVVAASDLICALPRRFVDMHAARLRVVARDAPFKMRLFQINAVVPKAALLDAGVSWLFAVLARAMQSPLERRKGSAARMRARGGRARRS